MKSLWLLRLEVVWTSECIQKGDGNCLEFLHRLHITTKKKSIRKKTHSFVHITAAGEL